MTVAAWNGPKRWIRIRSKGHDFLLRWGENTDEEAVYKAALNMPEPFDFAEQMFVFGRWQALRDGDCFSVGATTF